MEMKNTRLRSIGICLLLAASSMAYAQNMFYDSLPVPPRLDAATVNLNMEVEYHHFTTIPNDSLNVPIQTFAFNSPQVPTVGSILGPTLIWREGRHQTTNITNNLPPEEVSTVHWHGAHIPAWTDGGPHQAIQPGSTFSPDFDVLDSVCTLWYHPHGLDRTYRQVQMGLAGVILVKELSNTIEDQLPHIYGKDDFPIILQDAFFKRGTTNPDSFTIDTTRVGAGRRMLSNGMIQPYLNVPPQPVRFRVLNGSTRLPYTIWIGPNNVAHLPYKLVASDGGFLPDSARTVQSLLTAPGIRYEIVFDFTNYAGQTLYLTMTPNTVEMPGDSLLIKFNVGALPSAPIGFVPPVFPAHDVYPYNAQTKTRNIELLGHASGNGPTGQNTPFSINSRQFVETTIDDTVNLGDTEIWEIVNKSNRPHPFHIHDIQFYVIGVWSTTGVQKPIPTEYLGRKDDIWVLPGDSVRFVTKFDDFGTSKPFDVNTDTYMYHCHILTHEDGYYANSTNFHYGMMQQFVVWNGIVSADAQTLTEDMQIYPNPAHDRLFLNGTSTKPSEVRIYDLQGKLLSSQSLAPFSGEVKLEGIENLAAGMILVEWKSAQGKFTKKVVVD